MTVVDVLRNQIEAGIEAERILDVAGPYLEKREKEELDALVHWYLSSEWNDRVALRHIAALGEIRRQHDDLKHLAAKSADARKKLYTTGS